MTIDLTPLTFEQASSDHFAIDRNDENGTVKFLIKTNYSKLHNIIDSTNAIYFNVRGSGVTFGSISCDEAEELASYLLTMAEFVRNNGNS